MTKHMIALVRLAVDMTQLVGTLVNFVLREDVQTLIDKLHQVLDLTIRQLHDMPDDTKPDPLHDAKFAAERIGVVDRTLRRLTKKGMLPVHSHINGKRWFRESDIERCRRYYRGE